MTKVLLKSLCLLRAACVSLCVFALAHATAVTTDKPAETLYLQLKNVGLDPSRVYQVREASLDRSAVHITLEDGTLAFTQDVMGRITGAFFEGEGEILLTPPNEVERRSMSVFTGMAILEERFNTAYFRFNDDVITELQPGLRVPENPQEFIDRWATTARNLAQGDATRLMVSFSRMLPAKGAASGMPSGDASRPRAVNDRFFHARLQGTKLGVFDVYFDSRVSEQVQVGQSKTAEDGVTYYDIWASFSPALAGGAAGDATRDDPARDDPVTIRRFKITTEVQPPTNIRAQARLQIDVNATGERALLFELSRFLQIESVKLNGEAAEFIHNPAIEGTELSRRGNDVVAVILPEDARPGQKLDLEFVYQGEVLAEAGNGLLYVGARGNWYPNRGLAMADYDLEFTYPPGWVLVATGRPSPSTAANAAPNTGELLTSHWISERPIPVAGFNLGKYKVAKTQAGGITVETYATANVERDFPKSDVQMIDSTPPTDLPAQRIVAIPSRPSPVRNEVTVGESAAQAIRYYADRFGPYPYSSLALTQLPGPVSQGWPGLVFLSSYAFLNEEDRRQLHFKPFQMLLQQTIPAHETAHQWWGDLIGWKSYRDQWFSEGLANYCALMMLQEKNPRGFREIMQNYRDDLLTKNKDGVAPKDAGPVTLGLRLLSSRFPQGYDAISYGRGTWLFHMLRTMLKDAASTTAQQSHGAPPVEEPFVRALRRVRQKYEGKIMSTQELLDAFAEDLPPSLRYEGKNSLDWFLESWVNGTSVPKLELKGVRFTPKGPRIEVNATILQKDAPQDLVTSVPIYAVVAGKQPVLLGRVFADGEESSFHIGAPAGTHKILIDPEQTLLTSPN